MKDHAFRRAQHSFDNAVPDDYFSSDCGDGEKKMWSAQQWKNAARAMEKSIAIMPNSMRNAPRAIRPATGTGNFSAKKNLSAFRRNR